MTVHLEVHTDTRCTTRPPFNLNDRVIGEEWIAGEGEGGGEREGEGPFELGDPWGEERDDVTPMASKSWQVIFAPAPQPLPSAAVASWLLLTAAFLSSWLLLTAAFLSCSLPSCPDETSSPA